jgi:hypothetical protein
MQPQIQDMKCMSMSMDLKVQILGFMAKKEAQLSRELSEKYCVPPEDVTGVVESFLEDAYGPAKRFAESIAENDELILLFIGKKDCGVCRRCEPIFEGFLMRHKELKVVKLDYSQPEGLLYHVIHDQDNGLLPLIAFIFDGQIKVVFTGECLCASVYEKCYSDILAESSQNI